MVTRNILVVEDEIIIAREIQKRLEMLGYQASIVSSGEEALKEIQKGDIDLIVMDVMLKGKIDGIETANEILAKHDIPIVFSTAHSDENTIERAKLAEPYGYVLKPVQAKEFQITIEMALYKHAAQKVFNEEKEWFSAMLNSFEQGLIAVDRSDRIQFMNKTAEKLSGWERKEATGKAAEEILILRLAHKEAPRLIKKDKKEVSISYQIKDITNSKKEKIGSLIVFTPS
jgi:PAS domain S-box-containing protein